MEFIMHPIGVIHSPFTDKDQTPIQASRSQAVGLVEVYPEFADGLMDIEELSHIHLLYVFHKSSGYVLQVKPFLDDREHGIFATRYPYRPQPNWYVNRPPSIPPGNSTNRRRRGCT
jgi:tRNA-Thr(GGU) m(6)t(6)A37 methyltransferase TsaA